MNYEEEIEKLKKRVDELESKPPLFTLPMPMLTPLDIPQSPFPQPNFPAYPNYNSTPHYHNGTPCYNNLCIYG